MATQSTWIATRMATLFPRGIITQSIYHFVFYLASLFLTHSLSIIFRITLFFILLAPFQQTSLSIIENESRHYSLEESSHNLYIRMLFIAEWRHYSLEESSHNLYIRMLFIAESRHICMSHVSSAMKETVAPWAETLRNSSNCDENHWKVSWRKQPEGNSLKTRRYSSDTTMTPVPPHSAPKRNH